MRKYLDLFLATFVLLLAGSVSVASYYRVVAVENSIDQDLVNIPLGTATFEAFQGNECVGSISTEVKVEPADVVTANGKLRLQFRGQRMLVTIALGAYFNPFGQLVNGEMKISSPQSSLSVKAKNPNPIQVALEIAGPNTTSANSFELPGPILSQHSEANGLSVKYDLLRDNSRTMMAGVAQGLALSSFAQLNLRVERGKVGASVCDMENAGGPALQVDSLIGLLNAQRDRLKDAMPGLLGTF